MREFARCRKENKWEGTMLTFWLLTVFSSFWGDAILSVTVPLAGEIFPFRVLLPITALLYLVWMLRGNDHIWKDSGALEKWVYVLIAVMMLYGALSLPRALDLRFTFRRLFNLCFDLCFFFLMLRLCRNEKWFRYTLYVVGAAVTLLCIMGVWEIFHGGIFNPFYDRLKCFKWFLSVYQHPVVSYGNTNDYSAALLMCFGILLLSFARRWHACGKVIRWLIALFFGAIYFLLLASTARLVLVCFYILLAGLTLFLLMSDRKRLWIVLVALCLVGGICFANQYRYIVPPIREYRAEMAAYQRGELQEKPVLHRKIPHEESLNEQFFKFDEDGNRILREEGSAGMRAHLLLHAWDCFKESYGLGVGLGNTETLAGQRNVVKGWAGNPQQSIHCFVVRIISDYGIFALLPLCAIGMLLLKYIVQLFSKAYKEKNKDLAAYALLFIAVLFTYPFTSTAPSDAQDIIAMWIYLAVVVLYASLQIPRKSEEMPHG